MIIDKCTEHGLARPEFDPTSGFFKTIIWRTGSDVAKGLVTGASRGLVKVLVALSGAGTPISSTAIANAMGKDRANSYIKRLLSSLLDDGLVETTGERKRGARLQKYRLTAKGVRLVAALKKKGGSK